MIIAVLTFAVTVVLVTGAYWMFVLRLENQERSKLKRRLKPTGAGPRRAALLKQAERLSSVASVDTVLQRVGRVTNPLLRLLHQSGLRMTVGTLVLAIGCAAGAAFFLVTVISGLPLLGAALAVPAGALPILYVRRARQKRMLKFEEHFPEAIDLIARALRAGHAFPTGLSMVADEMPDPIGAEFRQVYEQQNFGMPIPEALRGFAARIPLLDARFFVTAVLTQREAGGNLAEVLDNLSAVIRERFKVKRQVRVISAHGRITGWVLAGLPPALSLGFFIVSPRHMQTLIGDPLGVRMLLGALVLQVVGTLIIRRIVAIEY